MRKLTTFINGFTVGSLIEDTSSKLKEFSLQVGFLSRTSYKGKDTRAKIQEARYKLQEFSLRVKVRCRDRFLYLVTFNLYLESVTS